MQQIRSYPVPHGSVGLWWLGQNGFIFKTPEGTLVSTDLYLTNSCAELYSGIGISLDRQVPVLIPPEDLEVDVFCCTHNHVDHTDPVTIRHLRHKDTMQFVGPHPSCGVFAAEGVESGRIIPAWPDCEHEFREVRLHGTFALPTDDTDLNHMGFVLAFHKGPRVYITGDTDYSDLLASAAKHKPDVVITCINGGFNNLSHWEAAQLVGKIQPKAAIPCHYDMFADNGVDPAQFRASLTLQAPDVRYTQMTHGEPLLLSF
ncbi:MAG: MBL fold metallo-hydrolase [Bryobacterales bacterium]|nr:MBL fold metallo-hydrolase [Bryobacterales bacterium]